MKNKNNIIIGILIALGVGLIIYFVVQIFGNQESKLKKDIHSWQGMITYNKELAEKFFVIANVDTSTVQYDNGQMYSYILKNGKVYFSEYDPLYDLWATTSYVQENPSKSDVTKLYEYFLQPLENKMNGLDPITVDLNENLVEQITLLLDIMSDKQPMKEIKKWSCNYTFEPSYIASVLCFEEEKAILKITFSSINEVKTSTLYQLPEDFPE